MNSITRRGLGRLAGALGAFFAGGASVSANAANPPTRGKTLKVTNLGNEIVATYLCEMDAYERWDIDNWQSEKAKADRRTPVWPPYNADRRPYETIVLRRQRHPVGWHMDYCNLNIRAFATEAEALADHEAQVEAING